MAIFELQTPDGKTFQVDAPDMATAASSLDHVSPPVGNASNWGMAPEATDMLTFGLQSKINALGGAAIDSLTGQGGGYWNNYDRRLQQQRGDQAAYGEQNPVQKRVAQGVGLGAGMMTLPALGPFKGAGLGSQVANTALTGGVYGGVAGASQDADTMGQRLENTALGAGIGAGLGPLAIPAAKAIGKGIGFFRGGAPEIKPPTTPELRSQKTAAYTESKNIGLTIKPGATNSLVSDVSKKFADDAFDADLEPKAAILLKRVMEARDKPLTLDELDNLRKKAVRIVQGNDKQEAHFAGKVIESVDNLMDNMNEHSVISGDPAAAKVAIEKARELAKRTRKAEVIETAFKKAENAVGANYTQAGAQTAIQQQFRRIADNEKMMRLFNPEEQAAILEVVHGTRTQKALNIIKKFAPSNSFALIGATFNPMLGTPALIAGQAAKTASAKITTNAAEKVNSMVRSGAAYQLPMNRLNPQLQARLRGLLSVQAGHVGGLLGSRREQ